jgi:hypothetical protein
VKVKRLRVDRTEQGARHSHFLAERSLMPAAAAVASCVFPSMRFRLNSLACASVIIEPSLGLALYTSAGPGDNRQF